MSSRRALTRLYSKERRGRGFTGRNEAKRVYAQKAADGRYLLHVAVHFIAIACPCSVYITELELEVTHGRVYRTSQGFDNRHQRAYSFLPAVIRGPET